MFANIILSYTSCKNKATLIFSIGPQHKTASLRASFDTFIATKKCFYS